MFLPQQSGKSKLFRAHEIKTSLGKEVWGILKFVTYFQIHCSLKVCLLFIFEDGGRHKNGHFW